jgi:hypothetical protein
MQAKIEESLELISMQPITKPLQQELLPELQQQFQSAKPCAAGMLSLQMKTDSAPALPVSLA